MKHSQFHCRCVLLFILVLFEVARHSSVEATEGLEAIAEKNEDSAITAWRDGQQTRLSFSKPVSDVSLNQDHASGTVQTMLEDASDMDDNDTPLRHSNPQPMKATATAVTKRRYLKKSGGGKVDKRDGEGKQDKKDSGGKVDKKESGKTSKKGQTTQNNVDTTSGLIDSSTVVQQQEQSIQAEDPLSTLSPPSPPDNNIFDRQSSSEFTSDRSNIRPLTPAPSPNPTTSEPTVTPTFSPTTRKPTEAPIVNTPVPTPRVTESFHPTDSSTSAATMEFTTLPPSFSPTPTA